MCRHRAPPALDRWAHVRSARSPAPCGGTKGSGPRCSSSWGRHPKTARYDTPRLIPGGRSFLYDHPREPSGGVSGVPPSARWTSRAGSHRSRRALSPCKPAPPRLGRALGASEGVRHPLLLPPPSSTVVNGEPGRGRHRTPAF